MPIVTGNDVKVVLDFSDSLITLLCGDGHKHRSFQTSHMDETPWLRHGGVVRLSDSVLGVAARFKDCAPTLPALSGSAATPCFSLCLVACNSWCLSLCASQMRLYRVTKSIGYLLEHF